MCSINISTCNCDTIELELEYLFDCNLHIDIGSSLFDADQIGLKFAFGVVEILQLLYSDFFSEHSFTLSLLLLCQHFVDVIQLLSCVLYIEHSVICGERVYMVSLRRIGDCRLTFTRRFFILASSYSIWCNSSSETINGLDNSSRTIEFVHMDFSAE